MSDLENINQILTEALSTGGGTRRADSDAEEPRARMLTNIQRRVKAPAPEGTTTISAADMKWEPFDTGIDRKLLVPDQGDGTETAVYRLEPGAKFVAHGHTHQETCWVVEGEVLVGDHLVQPGEMHVANIGHEHPEIVARTEAVLLIRSQNYIGPLTPP